MTDQEQALADKEHNAIAKELMAICPKYDTRVLFVSLMSFAATIGQKLIAVNLLTPEDAKGLLELVAKDLATPLATPVSVQYKDGDNLLAPTSARLQ
jgi:hypothetical protein